MFSSTRTWSFVSACKLYNSSSTLLKPQRQQFCNPLMATVDLSSQPVRLTFGRLSDDDIAFDKTAERHRRIRWLRAARRFINIKIPTTINLSIFAVCFVYKRWLQDKDINSLSFALKYSYKIILQLALAFRWVPGSAPQSCSTGPYSQLSYYFTIPAANNTHRTVIRG